MNKKNKYFDTFKEALDFLSKNFNGHGPIYSNDDKMLHNCRCSAVVHKQMDIPKVIINMTEQEYLKSDQNPFKDYEDNI